MNIHLHLVDRLKLSVFQSAYIFITSNRLLPVKTLAGKKSKLFPSVPLMM